MRTIATLRLLLPLGAVLVVIVGLQVWWSQGYSPTGHAAEHFGSASIVFSMAFVLTALVWGLPAPERRRPLLWALLGLVAVAAALNTQGNIWVVDALGEGTSVDAADTVERLEAGHDRAGLGGLAGVAAAGGVAVWLGARGVITRRLTIGAVAASVLFPFWIFPGLGLVIIAGVLVLRRVRQAQPPRRSTQAPTRATVV